MKRVNYMSAGLIAMTLAGVMLPITSVFAADEPIKKTSVGEVRVGVDPDNPDPNNPDNPDGSKDILSLVKVPDLKFKSVSVEQLATGQQTLPLTSNTVTDKPVKNEPAGNASDGNNQGLLNITDYRGTGAGWKLEAQAGELKNAAGIQLLLVRLSWSWRAVGCRYGMPQVVKAKAATQVFSLRQIPC